MKLIMEEWKKYLQESEDSNDNVVLKLPKFRISEQWGTPGSHDRKIIEMFTSKIHGNSFKEKIESYLTSLVRKYIWSSFENKIISEEDFTKRFKIR